MLVEPEIYVDIFKVVHTPFRVQHGSTFVSLHLILFSIYGVDTELAWVYSHIVKESLNGLKIFYLAIW